MKNICRISSIVLLLNLIMVKSLNGQCQITYNSPTCLNSAIEFYGSNTGTTHKFVFNGEDSITGQRIVKYAFKTTGLKKISYFTRINGKPCSSFIYLTIKPLAVLKYRLNSPDTQCFEKNLFCFRDSFYHPAGAAITGVNVTLDDGQFFEFAKPKMPADFCFSIRDERGGKFRRMLEVQDENGCISRDTSPYFFVHEKLGPRFTRVSQKNPGCDSVKTEITNISRIASTKVKSSIWQWTDGSTDNGWGPQFFKTFRKNGIYDGRLILESKSGCRDTYNLKSVAIVVGSDIRIVSGADTVCYSNNPVTFQPNFIPSVTSSALWNFGDPITGMSNTSKDFISQHAFSKPGPFQVKLTMGNTVCGNIVAFDTILVSGPLSLIEKAGARMAEHEVYQCTGGTHDSVHFTNASLYYQNDDTPEDEDSAVFVNGKRRIVFTSQQQPLLPKGYVESTNRSDGNLARIWDFGDEYALKCTTDIKRNINANCNCRYSTAEKPVHLYKDWEAVMWEKYKFQPMEEAVFIEANRSCRRIPVHASDSFIIFEDSLLIVPASTADIAMANGFGALSNKRFLQEKFFHNGVRTVSEIADVKINAGSAALIRKSSGQIANISGPATARLYPGDRISSNDSVFFQLTLSTKRDTLPFPFFKRRYSQPFNPKVISGYKKTYSGTAGVDYIVSFQRYTELYNSRIPYVYTATLTAKDTVHPLKCESKVSKQIVWMHADAGSRGAGLRTKGQYCLTGASPNYGVTFMLSDLKPGASFSDVQINYDSSCGKNNFQTLNKLQPGGLPPGLYFPGYQLYGNVPSTFSHQYTKNELCNAGGCPTIGIIVGNGVSKSGNKPLCADTQWYSNLVCFDLADAAIKISANKPRNGLGVLKICRGDTVYMQHPAENKTSAYTVANNLYEFTTDNAGTYYSKISSRYVSETYVRNSLLKDSGNSKLYNYLVITRGGQDPQRIPGSHEWKNGPEFLLKKPDTIVTAVITKWDTIADVSNAWEQVKAKLLEKQFDPYSVDGKTLAKLIWNGKGIIGQPATGARGCIDTAGFGSLISFSLQPVPGFTKVLHFRDTSLQPLDSAVIDGKKQAAYTMTTLYNGYYLARRIMLTNKGCRQMDASSVVSGFATFLEYPDSTVCQDQGNSLAARVNARYFHPDPLNFGTWDYNDYWLNPVRQIEVLAGRKNREGPTRWDWNKEDDDWKDTQTIFGGAPYGATGIGGWIQLGGGGPRAIYYKQDSGIYTWRVALSDSTGCHDTFSNRVFVTHLDPAFDLKLEIPSCHSIIEFFDKSILHDPCKWAMRNPDSSSPMNCDFIREYRIDWGDGREDVYNRTKPNDQLLPPRIGHKYIRNGWFRILVNVITDQGCADSISRWVNIPGPRPSFEFANSAGNEITINQNETVDFKNTSDSASIHADFTWFFGDGNIKNTRDIMVQHQFTKPGDFYVFLEQYDSLIRRPDIKRYCPSTFPDTSFRPGMIVHVIPTNSIHVTPSGKRIYGFPNPVSGTMRIRGSQAEKVEVIQISGKSSGTFHLKDEQTDLSSLPGGVYLIRGCEPNGECWQLRVVKI